MVDDAARLDRSPADRPLHRRPVTGRASLSRALVLAMLLAGLSPAMGPLTAGATESDAGPGEGEPLSPWLVLGPWANPSPALTGQGSGTASGASADGEGADGPSADGDGNEEEAAQGEARGDGAAAPTSFHAASLEPGAGREVPLAGGEVLTWQAREAPAGRLAFAAPAPSGGPKASPRRAVAATYLEAERLLEVQVTITSPQPLEVFLDGESVAAGPGETGGDGEGGGEGEDGEGGEDSPPETTAELTLTPGRHLLVVRSDLPSGTGSGNGTENGTGDAPPAWWLEARWRLAAADGAERAAAGAPSPLRVTTDRRRPARLADFLDAVDVGRVAVSADGDLVAVQLAQPSVPAEGRQQWIEIRRTDDGRRIATLRGLMAGSFAWAPSGHRYLYTTREESGGNLWVGDLTTGLRQEVLSGVEDLGAARWSPATDDRGGSIVYGVSVSAEDEPDGVKLMRGLPDRWPGWRDGTHLFQLPVRFVEADGAAGGELRVETGIARQITGGEARATLVDLSPDGARALVTWEVMAPRRPFFVNRFHEIDLATLESEPLGEMPWVTGGQYSPDGRSILFTGSPAAFDGAGRDLPEGVIANDYDTQAYLYERSTGRVTPLTRDFDPSVQTLAWAPDGRTLLLSATAGEEVALYRYHLEGGRFERLEAGVEVIGSMDLSRDGSTLVVLGSSAATPPRVVALAGVGSAGDVGPPRTLYRPSAEVWDEVRLGEVRELTFTSDEGRRIVGRVHLPPGYDPEADPERRYPAIVNYYGGVVPIGRSFGGRYPRNYWAARGYVVYHLQPSGSVGFGQEFSALHVNDWGRRVSGEIVQGIDHFLEAYPAVDGERVGCIGASYGGFMTMLLITETDRCAAAIAHAGISSIASYWGEGWWGVLYSSAAAVDSYPWNRPDLYVEQSPLYRADRIDTPLLLVHGSADTNVPVGESEQLWAALEVLGKEVAFLEVEGEDHHILQYDKRRRWAESLVAWFDRYLKDEPGAWRHLYPDDPGLARDGREAP